MARTLHGFPGGISPPERKERSTQSEIMSVPNAPLLVLPLKQHIGAPAIPVVAPGQRVRRGQLLAKRAATRSVALHAPADGVIRDIALHPVPHDSGLPDLCIRLATDRPYSADTPEDYFDDSELSETDLLDRVAAAGIVGLGGAGFPTVAKLVGEKVEYLIINGVECEPYISCDDRLMRERSAMIVNGIRILARLLKAEQILLAIEDNKAEAIAAMSQACADSNIEVVTLPTLYPSGAQKQLIQNLTGIEIPQGKHSIDIGIVMYNVATCHAVARALVYGEPLISRVITVAGNAVDRPGNYEVPIGTPISFLLRCAGLRLEKLQRVIMGGPLMGIAIHDLNAPVTKRTNCLIAAAHDELDMDLRARECIRCGYCTEVCPATLLPQQLYWMIKSEQLDKAQALHLDACIECGACAYVCPSHIPLVQYYRYGKAALYKEQKTQREAEQAKQAFDGRELRLVHEAAQRKERLLHSATIAVATENNRDAIAVTIEAAAETAAPVTPDRSADVAAALARVQARKNAKKDAT